MKFFLCAWPNTRYQVIDVIKTGSSILQNSWSSGEHICKQQHSIVGAQKR